VNLLSACHSPVLLKFCNQLYDLNIRYRYLAGQAIDYSKRDIGKEHTDIMNAAVDRDADLACRMLLDHYRNTGAFLEKHFSSEAAE
jgi:DNA-binding GntR family transcriptional regulator